MTLRIARHDRSDIVEFEDGSSWRIWPADVPATLQWMPSTEFDIAPAADELCSHVLVNRADNSRVRVIAASELWPLDELQNSLKKG